MRSTSSAYPVSEVRAYVDEFGVPHIYADTEEDFVYGLGFFHAKDRLWQLVSQRAGIFGRLTEIFGEDLLESDRLARMVTYRIEEEFAALAPRDRKMMASYAAGVNDGAAYAGKSLEMIALGVEFERFEAIHCLGIVRFFGWLLSTGIYGELARNRVMARLPEGDPRREALLEEVDSLGYPVVRTDEHSGLTNYLPQPIGAQRAVKPRSAPRPTTKYAPSKGPAPRHTPAIEAMMRTVFAGGATNVWAVSGEHTEHGHAVLSHDPHLGHWLPALFYLAHMEAEGISVAGASIPGGPGILVGQGNHIVWGTPVSNVDTMDLVRIAPAPGRDDAYLLDGQEQPYDTVRQVYRGGRGPDAPILFEENWKVTVFGPVLPENFDHLMEEGDEFALMWPGHVPLSNERRVITAISNMIRADDIDEATFYLQHLTSPPVSVGIAMDDGTIAYRLAGDIPVRKSNEPVGFPRDGRFSDAGWETFLPPEYKPQLTNPPSGLIVAANQKIVEPDGPQAEIIGIEGTVSYRAQRITERLQALIDSGQKLSTADIVAIQQDASSAEADLLAPVFAAHCPTAIDGVDATMLDVYCTALADFDGVHDTDSRGALLYDRTRRRLFEDIIATHLGDEVVEQMLLESFTQAALRRALLAFDATGDAALLDDPDTDEVDGLAPFFNRAAAAVIADVTEQLGDDPAAWRWGAGRTFSPKAPGLGDAPLIGPLFTAPASEEAGCDACPRAETGERDIVGGAVLRISAEMSDPPQVQSIIDTGQSGHVGHRHHYDLYERWSKGELLTLARGEATADQTAEARVVFLPKDAP